MASTEITTTVKIDLDIKTAAQWFSALSDEQQADFFVEVAAEANRWPTNGMHWGYQFWLVGRHLRDCNCSSDDARQLVREISEGMAPEELSAVA